MEPFKSSIDKGLASCIMHYINNEPGVADMSPTKLTLITQDGAVRVTAVTTRSGVKAALIGNFNGQGYRVISLHSREELAKPESVFNCKFTDVRVAYPV
jgi:hypothetical protein